MTTAPPEHPGQPCGPPDWPEGDGVRHLWQAVLLDCETCGPAAHEGLICGRCLDTVDLARGEPDPHPGADRAAIFVGLRRDWLNAPWGPVEPDEA